MPERVKSTVKSKKKENSGEDSGEVHCEKHEVSDDKKVCVGFIVKLVSCEIMNCGPCDSPNT